MKLSAFRFKSLTFSLVIDSALADRFRLLAIASITISGLGERFVDETGGDEDDWTSESFSLSFELLFVSSVIDRFMKFKPDDEDDEASALEFPEPSAELPFVKEFDANVWRSQGKSW